MHCTLCFCVVYSHFLHMAQVSGRELITLFLGRSFRKLPGGDCVSGMHRKDLIPLIEKQITFTVYIFISADHEREDSKDHLVSIGMQITLTVLICISAVHDSRERKD